MKKKFVLVLLLVLGTVVGCDYSTEVKKSVSRVLKQDFKSYYFYGTPAGNFGIGTMYLKDAKLDPSMIGDNALIAIPETYFNRSVTKEENEAIIARLFPEGKIGDFSLNEKLDKNVGFDVALPQIYQVLSIGGTLDYKKGVTVQLAASKAAVRKLNWTELKRAMAANQISEDIKDHLAKRDVIIAMDDIVLGGYEATVTIDTKTNAGLDAALAKNVGKVFGDASLKMKIESGQDGTYHIKADNPVIAAVLFREIPSGVLSDLGSNDWPVVAIKEANMQKLLTVYKQKASQMRDKK